MKIDSIDKFGQLSNPAAVKPKQQGADFGSLLEETIEKAGSVHSHKTHSINSITPAAIPITETMHASEPAPTPGKATCQLLDSLEDYQQQLGDPEVSLRNLYPMVERMQKQLIATEPLFNALPESHPAKSILQETMSHISEEIGRFNSGRYVDRD